MSAIGRSLVGCGESEPNCTGGCRFVEVYIVVCILWRLRKREKEKIFVVRMCEMLYESVGGGG